MKIDSVVVLTGKRIAGTLHKRGYVHPTPSLDEQLLRESAEKIETEVAGRHESCVEQDHEWAR